VTTSNALEQRVIGLVAEALDVDPSAVTPSASLVDDLGAESIDFLDILFRVESAFGIKIPNDELWRGSFASLDDPDALSRGVASLRERWPDFNWDRLPTQLRKTDLPRLITVRTIVEYLERRGGTGGATDKP
jgi:acyl carrier protein